MTNYYEYVKGKGLPVDWFHGLTVMTAEEVKRMPLGTRILIIGADRHGEKSTLVCAVVQSGKKKALAYRDEWGIRCTKPIREMPRKAYAVEK